MNKFTLVSVFIVTILLSACSSNSSKKTTNPELDPGFENVDPNFGITKPPVDGEGTDPGFENIDPDFGLDVINPEHPIFVEINQPNAKIEVVYDSLTGNYSLIVDGETKGFIYVDKEDGRVAFFSWSGQGKCGSGCYLNNVTIQYVDDNVMKGVESISFNGKPIWTPQGGLSSDAKSALKRRAIDRNKLKQLKNRVNSNIRKK